MADIKWSAFPNGGAMVSGDQVVGLRSGANTQLTPVTSSQIQSFAFNAAGATGVNDAFVVTLSPAPAALTDGLLITMDSAGLENLTTTPTLKVNSFAAKPIVTFAGAPAPGDIQQNEEYIFVYSLTNDRFQLINPSTTTADTFQVQSSGYSYALDTGVANAYIANILPAQLTTQSGLQIVMTAVNANSGASTLTVNGATHSILLSNGSALTGGEIIVNGIYQFFYSAALTAYVLVNPSNSITISDPQMTVTGTLVFNSNYFSSWKSGLDKVSGYQGNLVTGNMMLSGIEPNVTAIDLGSIQIILNSVSWTMNSLTSVTATNLLIIIGGVTINSISLATLSIPNLTLIGNLAGTMTALTTLTLPNLIGTQGSLNFTANALTSLSFPALTSCANTFGPTCNALTSLSIPVLANVGGSFIPNCNILTSISAPVLVSILAALGGTLPAMTSFSAPSLTNIGTTFSPTWAALTTLTLTNLTTITGAFAAVFATLTTLSLPALTTLGATWSTTMALVTTTDFSSLQTVTGAVTASFAALATLTFPAIVSFGSTVTFIAANLVTFSLGATLKSVGGNWSMAGMKLNQASVDGILVSLAALDGTGGTTAYSSRTVNLSGGTSATPSATGLAAKAVLVARGCTVTNN